MKRRGVVVFVSYVSSKRWKPWQHVIQKSLLGILSTEKHTCKVNPASSVIFNLICLGKGLSSSLGDRQLAVAFHPANFFFSFLYWYMDGAFLFLLQF